MGWLTEKPKKREENSPERHTLTERAAGVETQTHSNGPRENPRTCLINQAHNHILHTLCTQLHTYICSPLPAGGGSMASGSIDHSPHRLWPQMYWLRHVKIALIHTHTHQHQPSRPALEALRFITSYLLDTLWGPLSLPSSVLFLFSSFLVFFSISFPSDVSGHKNKRTCLTNEERMF